MQGASSPADLTYNDRDTRRMIMNNYGKYKGEYGYRTHHRKMQIGMVAFGAAMILAQLAARHFVEDQAWKNILTVMAILSVLPTANIASPLFAGWRFKTPPKEFYDRVHPYEERFTILYDLVITSKEFLIIHSSGRVYLSLLRELI